MSATARRTVAKLGEWHSHQPNRFFDNSKPPFAATPEGQRQWLEAVNDVVLQTPHRLGRGVFWWEPAATRV